MPIPHRNDAPSAIAGCPGNNNKPVIKIPGCYKSLLTILAPVIKKRVLAAHQHFFCVGKIQTALLHGPAAFGFIP